MANGVYFSDLDELLSKYEQHRSTNAIAIMENLTIRLENAVRALTNKEAVLEMVRNFQFMFWDCHRRCEFSGRTRCSQVAVLSLSSPNRVDTRQVGRPKFDIKEETLVELRSLGFSWEDISRMLLVSRWTIHRRVSEFGLTHLSRFSDITDEQLDSKVSAFLVNLVTKRQLVNILFDLEIHTYDGSPKTSTGNSWPFPELLPC